MQTKAVVLSEPGKIGLESVGITPPTPQDIVVEIRHSGISTGTEKLFWSGEMPPFPGMGYPLIPGYEASGEVVEAGAESGFRVGETVFVPGANCYDGAYGLFGAASKTLITRASRVTRIDAGTGVLGQCSGPARFAGQVAGALGIAYADSLWSGRKGRDASI